MSVGGASLLLTTGQAARLLRRSVQTVRWYANRGQLTVVRDARGTRWLRPEEVERLADALRALASQARGCRFCGASIPQRRRYCPSVGCQRRRNRLRQQRFAARFRAQHGMSYRRWREQDGSSINDLERDAPREVS